MNTAQEIQNAADLLREANAAAPAGSLGTWEPFYEARHRDRQLTIWTFGLRVGNIFAAIVEPAFGGWVWSVSYVLGVRGKAPTATEALAAAREAAQEEARKWAR